jgi:hypothetical protein
LFNKKLKKDFKDLYEAHYELKRQFKTLDKEVYQLRCDHRKTMFTVSTHPFTKPYYVEVCTICEKTVKYYKKSDLKIAKALA